MGSWLAITDNSGSLKNHYNYDAWGRRRDPVTWKLCPINPASASIGGSMLAMQPRFDRGYTGHEQMAGFALINMNGRMYDPYLQRFLSPDNEIQSPGDAQSFNRYTYCLNNPLLYTDPTGYTWLSHLTGWIGENWKPLLEGAIFGAASWESVINYNSGNYNLGQAIGMYFVNGASMLAGYGIGTSGIPFASTLATMGGSTISSSGRFLMTGGKSDFTVSFGVASYNFTQNDWGYLGKKGNSALENIGYGLGALANIKDINLAINSTQATLNTDNSDFISHSSIKDNNTGEALMSYGPNDNNVPSTKLGFAFNLRASTSDYHLAETLPVDLTVDKYAINLVRALGGVLPYQGATVNCVNMASLSLWLNGIPNIGLQPYLLYATTWAYSQGFRPDLFSYYLLKH